MGVAILGLFFDDLDSETVLRQLSYGGVPAFGYATARIATAILGPIQYWKYALYDLYYYCKAMLSRRYALQNIEFRPSFTTKKRAKSIK